MLDGLYRIQLNICRSAKKEADDYLNQLLVPDLVKALLKCAKEEKTDEEGQPLYIDDSCDMIKCKWCPNFKGSRIINQHCKSSKNHITRRRQLLGEDPLKGIQGLQNTLNPPAVTYSYNH